MTGDRNYKHICDRLGNVFCPDHKLSLIKEHFSENIDSPRRFDRINNIAKLLRILEKRDCLSTEEISPLKYIARELQDNNIIALIEAYESYDKSPQVPISNERNVKNRVIPQIEVDPIERVYRLICSEIGQKWKDLARALSVPEGQIDDLEHRYLRISDMTREVLLFHREASDERYWKVKLCNGLTVARRNDLRLQIQDLFARHGLM
ncbi:hypothetical protein NQ314_013204 [Rhamnusium bicolor]|uniref:Death domain-containing protein n=1 Tax=Rhamnusium bicolor TaxID=1586634 RepID=A0AAV8X878_9CUCU|nr:hypothetical protein NQ314_013204 [Rhamnusium bicolor]